MALPQVDSNLVTLGEFHRETLLQAEKYAAGIVRNPVIGEDIVSEAFHFLCKAFASGYHPKLKLRRSLYRKIHQLAIDHFRMAKRYVSSDPGSHLEVPIECKEFALVEHEACHTWSKSIFSPAEREIAILYYEKGVALKEVAKMRGITYGSAKNATCRIVQKLRTNIT